MTTHTYEIIVGDVNQQGEISFNGGTNTTLTMNEKPVNMSLKEYKRIGKFLSGIEQICKDYGEITKIEIRKIGYID